MDDKRGRSEWQKLYNTKLWKDLRRIKLDSDPLCQRCRKMGELTAATVVHHMKPHKGDWDLFNDLDNLESLCNNCHNTDGQHEDDHGYSKMMGADGWPIDDKHPINRRPKR